jgi:hypothetical protein
MAETVTSAEDSASMPLNSNRILICKSGGCFDMATISGFCRLHYLSNWKSLKTKEARKKGKDLKSYLVELSSRFPEEFFDKLKNEIEEMGTEAATAGADADERSPFDSNEPGDDDLDTIIKGIRVEDF